MSMPSHHLNPEAQGVLNGLLRRATLTRDTDLIYAIRMLECEETSRRWFLFMCVLDWKAVCSAIPNESDRAKISNYSYWSVIMKWMNSLSSNPSSASKRMAQSVLEVSHCIEVVQAMFGKLPQEGDYMITSVENMRAVANVLLKWDLSSEIQCFSVYEANDARRTARNEIENLTNALSHKETVARNKKRLRLTSPVSGKELCRYIQKRIPVTFKLDTRDGSDAIIVNRLQFAALSMLCVGMKDEYLPGGK